MTIKIFVTGGTFDKEYNELDGSLHFKDSHIPEMLTRGRFQVPVDWTTLMMMDSLDMTDSDRQTIAQHCISTPEKNIVITHGTDSMVETASVIAQLVKDKTIVLVGAMVPYTFSSSDGFFNLGTAFAFVQTLPMGVYIAMNGRYFKWNNVRKNKKEGIFEEIN
ncbi:MAG: asparaginase [Saprospiraceae bacterium]|nr:asparaginase [Saprospiraceae bacterium]MDP4814002.1 asparaginase [Saprospiraceae bacterium]MDP5048375.1 asparaginase [Saprospiraceae bacterium]